MYAIVTDGTYWWVQGDEGRVSEQPWTNRRVARDELLAMQEDGKEVDSLWYYTQTDEDEGPDWDDPLPLR